jgi:Protein of unknown function (DUF2505)
VKIERSMHHDLRAGELYEMACSKRFQEQMCIDAGALSYDVHITRTDDGAIVKTRRKLATAGFPPLLRRFLPSGLSSTETVVWAPVAPDGSRSARLHVDFAGAPASLSGTIRIQPDGPDAAAVLVDATFTARVPFLRRRLEGFAVPIILGVIDAEERTSRAWTARSR